MKTKINKEQYGKILVLLKEQNISQEDLGNALNKSQSTISRIISGITPITPEQGEKLYTALGEDKSVAFLTQDSFYQTNPQSVSEAWDNLFDSYYNTLRKAYQSSDSKPKIIKDLERLIDKYRIP